jgi:hypothetical protein
MTTTEWNRPIPHWSQDPFAGKTTFHGLPTDEVRSAVHKYVRQGTREQSVRAALELARTDEAHEEMLWTRLAAIATEDIGLGDPNAICVVAALKSSTTGYPFGSWERLGFACQAAGFLAACPKEPSIGEIMQVVFHEDRVVEIPDEALCIHTRRGQELGRTMYDWFTTGTRVSPEVQDRDRSYQEQLPPLYLRLDPPQS